MTEKRNVEQYVLPGEIKQYDDYQVFECKGKDARGYDFGVRLLPVQAIPLMDEPVQPVDADRVFMYAGGDLEDIEKIEIFRGRVFNEIDDIQEEMFDL